MDPSLVVEEKSWREYLSQHVTINRLLKNWKPIQRRDKILSIYLNWGIVNLSFTFFTCFWQRFTPTLLSCVPSIKTGTTFHFKSPKTWRCPLSPLNCCHFILHHWALKYWWCHQKSFDLLSLYLTSLSLEILVMSPNVLWIVTLFDTTESWNIGHESTLKWTNLVLLSMKITFPLNERLSWKWHKENT